MVEQFPFQGPDDAQTDPAGHYHLKVGDGHGKKEESGKDPGKPYYLRRASGGDGIVDHRPKHQGPCKFSRYGQKQQQNRHKEGFPVWSYIGKEPRQQLQ